MARLSDLPRVGWVRMSESLDVYGMPGLNAIGLGKNRENIRKYREPFNTFIKVCLLKRMSPQRITQSSFDTIFW